MSNRWNNLQKRPMSRKDFLKLIGVGLLVLVNLDAVIKLFSGHSVGSAGHKSAAVSYGGKGYGDTVGKRPTKLS